MGTLKCSCGFQGNVPDKDKGKEFVCTQCGRKLIASENKAERIAQRTLSGDSERRSTSCDRIKQEKEIKVKFNGGIGPVGTAFEEIKEARKKLWKGAFLLIIFGIITLLSSRVSTSLAVVTSLPAIYGVGLLLWGYYEYYIHEHGIPRK